MSWSFIHLLVKLAKSTESLSKKGFNNSLNYNYGGDSQNKIISFLPMGG